MLANVKGREQAGQQNEYADGQRRLWVKCSRCGEMCFIGDLKESMKVCLKCDYHFRLTAHERLRLTLDEGSFVEYESSLHLEESFFPRGYSEKLAAARQLTGLNEALVIGEGAIEGCRVAVGIMDPRFIMASMGIVVGEKVARLIELARTKRLPLLIFCSSGGARMQEGVLSLLQMVKTSASLAEFAKEKLLYISVLTDPTTGGVSASFAFLGDIIIAEPGALIGFAGPRVIEQTIRQKLPEGFQRSEFLCHHGFIDMVVSRKRLKQILAQILALHQEQ